MKINIAQIEAIEYKEALDIQLKLQEMRQQGKIEDTLLLLEHFSVLTVGKKGGALNIIAPRHLLNENKVAIYEVGRGGDVTYHGPGQIVGYPIVELRKFGRDIKRYIWNIQEMAICMLNECYNISAHREGGKYTGVWVNNEKIMAIGVSVKRWVSMHGFAMNINTQMEHFKWILPCGISDKGVTSLSMIKGQPQDIEKAKKEIIQYFCKIFGYEETVVMNKEQLEQIIAGR